MALPPPGGHTGNDVTREDIFKEINILLELNHPNIIYLREYFEEANRAYLITEHLAGGELLDAVLAAGHYSEADARQAFRQLLQGVQYLHSKGYTHRDLKLENLLLSRPGDLSALKIADFGLAKDHVDAPLSTVCGTPQYVAPEVILRGRARTGSRGAPYGMQCDLWSAGVILFILLGGYPPFYDESEPRLFNKIRAARFAFDDPVWDKISDEAKDLVCKLLVVDPEARLTADQALAHAWLQQPPPGPAAPKTQLLATMSRMRASMKQRSWRPGQPLEEDGPQDSLASTAEDPAQQRENYLARQIIEEERESARAGA
ncbi:protein kinase [Helicosporidium sp. ATCC 50920]|nr:protein kinase [Helicosporidium sp. ATCC 50920]|eukprot:KDD72402.1 protein kinase [Helicosporidium sp. ATCC 50920]